ncbi:hypothetical protein MPE84_20685, partial [Aeromonas veronii]|uniref:hypothetical protein n=1 Tax=Aeromonas veronii TaxID=654 RepID=UPI001FD6FF53
AATCLRKIWWINMFCPLDRGYEKGPERLAQGLMFWMNMVLICVLNVVLCGLRVSSCYYYWGGLSVGQPRLTNRTPVGDGVR